ncbi:MAG: ion transporter [Kiritimatiellia bacterium]|jgi:voltage-gated potassium channel|nr:ion transporter [Kiritimatiellia bacterium]
MADREKVDIVDENQDRLDDRIVRPDETAEDSVPDIASRLGNLRLTELPVELLRSILMDIEGEQNRLTKEASRVEKELHQELLQGNASNLDEKKREIRLIEREFESFENDRLKVYNALQDRIVNLGMEHVLGGRSMLYLSEGIIFVLIILVLGAMSYELLYFDPELDSAMILNIFYFDTFCCAIFMADFCIRHRQAEDKQWYWRHHWIDFVTSIPIPPLALLENATFVRYGRTLRLVRVIRLLRLGRAFRILFFFWRGMDKLSEVLDIKLMKKSIRGLILAILIGAFIIHYFEGGKDPSVGNLMQSIWWSFTTVVTGGFGDIYNPESGAGRILTVMLIVAGMVVVGVFTATLTSLYVEEGTEELQMMQKTLEEKFSELAASHEQGVEERQQGMKEREALDRNLKEGLEQIFRNQEEMTERLKELESGMKERGGKQ